jgi:festuclavine dehydrogenase
MSDPVTVLLLGGTGKVASCIGPLLKQHGHTTIVASRKGNAPLGFIGCHFDWSESASFDNPFDIAPNITSVFLVAPPFADPFPPMKLFINFALTKGVNRFVLLSASVCEAGGPAMGHVHQYLMDIKVDFAALRPSWFMG